MWNPEARDSSLINFTFMSSWERTKMPPLLGRRRTRSKRAEKSTAVEDFARYSVEDAQDAAAAGKEGDKGRRCRGGGDKG